MFDSFSHLKYEVSNRKCFITLNRPDKRNALNFDLIAELRKAFDRAEEDHEVKVVILRGEGKVFCAGADLEYLQRLRNYNYQENLKDSENLKDLLFKIYGMRKVVIAQIHGHAIAGGAGLAAVCDFSFAVPEANFGYTEVKLGFIPAIVGVFLIRKIGEGRARELMLSGTLIGAERAKEIGLISHISSIESLEEAVHLFADELIQNTSSHSIALTKELCLKVHDLPISEGLNFACQLNAKMRESEDFKKGVGAFLKKETPRW